MPCRLTALFNSETYEEYLTKAQYRKRSWVTWQDADMTQRGLWKSRFVINKILEFKEKYKSGDISREEYINSGATEARIFSDSIYDAIQNPPKSNGTGKAVMKGRGGKFKGVN